MTTETEDRPARAELSRLLWELHEAAMDASNDPTTDTIRAVDKAYRKAKAQLLVAAYEQQKSRPR